MTNQLNTNDKRLTAEQIGQLENPTQLIHFFAFLGYNVDDATPLDHTALGLDSADLRHQIQAIHLIGVDPVDAEITIYLMQVRSVTVQLRQTIARRFRERPGDTLLLLTSDFETLDFVLLDESLQESKSPGKPYRRVLRPRAITVNRRNPSVIARRVLQRFTFTEADSIYQWDKLKSAFSLAEWSEPYFNNRALFSDYYLQERLTDKKLTPEWREDVRPIARQVLNQLSDARATFTKQPESVVRRDLYEPLFTELGFHWVMNKASDSGAEEPDYLLYSAAGDEKPIAAAVTTPWNRNLDNPDEERDADTPNEIPGALVVSVLENDALPNWVIMTNGKHWRLYAAQASNKATNYYEIDLEEAVNALDPQDIEQAVKYWWLFFRRAAFTGFLDELLQASEDYARGLRDRLKDRVFTQIFPHFAAGFIYDIRAEAGKADANFGDDALAWVYEGTLTFLYRLMFVLYAESLELLPLAEARGYREDSLYKLKREIADAAGTVEDEAPDKLKQTYGTNATDLYRRLQTLFVQIDTGSKELNLPTYNGGLFSQSSETGEFLADYAIPDRHLALGLDRLCRDVDEKTQALVFIDYKSLGVRQLGSIYEGLLEFQLRIAPEKLAVIKEKGKEVYVPLARLDQSRRLVQSIDAGAVYLENDKRERKATGSYYTPDYIVKYIVEHTVGPVLARKFDELEPRLREAQKKFRRHKELVAARGNDQPAELLWRSDEMRQLADDCLNVRVLDPAMGSGHFLVEVVDFVSNRLIDFLNGWSENPVWGMLDQIREEILADMERQSVTIDPARLTRVALLKRAVLKRCVYGVDLNGMAVELAKVSLWLDAFTLGAPLSFLDHHLKHGNSLIGARIREVEEAVEGTADKAVQLSLFSDSAFTGLSMATEMMRQVSYLSDNTVAQVNESRETYQDARGHLAHYKRLLDVYTSRWFGNEPTKKLDAAVEFIRNGDTRNWLKRPDGPPPAAARFDSADVARTALKATKEKRFFHWELEFPEIFFAPSKPGGQDVQLQTDGGFDAVIGNPPYGVIETLPGFENELLSDLFVYFWALLFKYVKPEGNGAFITPSAWLTGAGYQAMREMILKKGQIHQVIILPYDVFPDAYIDTCIAIIGRSSTEENYEVQVCHMEKRERGENIWSQELANIEAKAWKEELHKRFLLNSNVLRLGRFYHLPEYHHLEEVIRIERGVQPYSRSKHSNEQIRKDFLRVNSIPERADAIFYPELLGEELSRYEIYPEKRTYLEYSDRLASKREEVMFNGKRMVLRRLLNRRRQLMSAVTEERLITTDNVINVLILHEKIEPAYVCALLNSSFIAWLYTNQSTISVKDDFPQITLSEVGNLPVRRIDFASTAKDRKYLATQITSTYAEGNHTGVLSQVQATLTADQSDVVHDVLAHLAQVMIDLNKQKQVEIKRFLGWLEQQLNIAPRKGKTGLSALTGYTIIEGYLGDYQKGEPELPWDEMEYRLHQNRSRYAANLEQIKGRIQAEYEQSLATLRPIKQQLAATDALIDKIVYQLYGLTDEEIALIEQPAYEQAFSEAKEKVRRDKKLQKDSDAALEAMAETVRPAAERLQSRVNVAPEEARLDADLPGWRLFGGDVPTFLRTGEYAIDHFPEHMDFSASVVQYAKAVEQAIMQRLFEPFRAAGHGPGDCKNSFLQKFMEGKKHLTLGSFPFILTSKEKTLAAFAERQYPGRGQRIFFDKSSGVRALLMDQDSIQLRNDAAHSEALSKEDAKQARTWALNILRYL